MNSQLVQTYLTLGAASSGAVLRGGHEYGVWVQMGMLLFFCGSQ